MMADSSLLLLILAAAIVLLSVEWVAADVIALGVLLSLVVTGILTPEEAFQGFGSGTVMMILGLLILTASLLRTGVVEMAGRMIVRRGGGDPDLLLLFIMVAVAALSAFISNTAATAFFLPVTFGVAARAKQSASKFLMPVAFASILSSSVTLVSTSTNIVVSELMTRRGMSSIGMFEMAPVGLPIGIAGLVYMWFVGRKLIPERGPLADPEGELNLGPYLTEVVVLPGSRLVGKTIAESGLGEDLDLTVIRVVRDKESYIVPRAETLLLEGDVLIVEGSRQDILKVKDTAGIDIKADVKLSEPGLRGEDVALTEAVLLPGSSLIGVTLKSSRFRERYGLQVLAIHRAGSTILRKISRIRLRMGDVLLLQGHRDWMRKLADGDALRVLGPIQPRRINYPKAPLAVAIFASVLGAATMNLFTLPVAVLIGALLVFLTGCITPDEAYREVEWKVVILIGCMLALGAAMEKTGTDRLIASRIVDLAGQAGPRWILTGFFAVTVLLTQPMSNQAAAIVVAPVAMQAAERLGFSPRTFAMMIAVAASCSYLTPLEPSCLMVYGPGRYRFIDFARVGGLLTLLIYVLAIALVPIVWPLAAGR